MQVPEPLFYVYVLTNTVNGKRYFGQTKDPYHRWSCHKSAARSGRLPTHPLYCSMRKHGIEAFTFVLLECFHTVAECDVREVALIAEHRTTDREFGYNIECGGEGHCEVTAETKAKISARVKAYYANGGVHHMKGKKQTPEVIAKMSASKRGKPNGQKGLRKKKPHWAKGLTLGPSGRKNTPETIVKMRAAALLREERKRQAA